MTKTGKRKEIRKLTRHADDEPTFTCENTAMLAVLGKLAAQLGLTENETLLFCVVTDLGEQVCHRGKSRVLP